MRALRAEDVHPKAQRFRLSLTVHRPITISAEGAGGRPAKRGGNGTTKAPARQGVLIISSCKSNGPPTVRKPTHDRSSTVLVNRPPGAVRSLAELNASY